MIHLPLSFNLPPPWQEMPFKTQSIGVVNFLVGPNGSGKSRFSLTLKSALTGARLLNTDRLQGMENTHAFKNNFGDHLSEGLAKNQFPHFRSSGTQLGSGIDTLILLEERLDLRIQVEATLGHLFNRQIRLEWHSGNLIATASVGSAGASYRLDKAECHGIKELLVMLTHLYNEENQYLIIDEPELNLHPQYQAFFMQEVRRMAGDPSADPSKKIIFLITHSPFILDFKSVEDVKSVMSFDLRHNAPKQLWDLGVEETTRISTLVPRLNVHHKQLFFSDSPVFVEGIIDGQLISAIQEARGVSMAGAGSCIIEAGGNEEVNHYLTLCSALGKTAYFLYDLDSLFRGNLRGCIRPDGSVQSFLAAAGVGGDFTKYCGELDRLLTNAIDVVLALNTLPAALSTLARYMSTWGLRPGWPLDKLAKGRAAVLTAVHRYRTAMLAVLTEATISDIEGRIQRICDALRQKNVLLLPGGALENYLPSYTGDPYEIPDSAKNATLAAELRVLAGCLTPQQLKARYGALYDLIALLPSKEPVDVNPVLVKYLGDYIHLLQGAIVANTNWGLPELQAYLKTNSVATERVFSLRAFQRESGGHFSAAIDIMSMLGVGPRNVVVTDQTNAGMRTFTVQTGAWMPPS